MSSCQRSLLHSEPQSQAKNAGAACRIPDARQHYSTVKKDQRETDHIPQWKKSYSQDNAYLAHLACVFPIVMDTTLL